MSIILISAPAFSYVTNSSHCDNDVLSTYTGPANLTANWQGNPITVTWYNDDTQYDSNQCTYGGNLTMPSSIPQKTGYTFRGWRVRQAASQVCSLTGSAVNALTYDDDDSTAYGCYSHDGQYRENESTYGLTAGGWAVKDTSGGIIKGIASCNSTTSAGEYDSYESDAFSSSSTGQYCWCKMTSYTPSAGGSSCNVASPSWVFYYDYEFASVCASSCATVCALGVLYNADFRRALFGVQ